MSLDGGVAALPFDRDTALLGRSVVQFFLQSTTAYDLLAESSKVVVFDVGVPMKVAFYALVEHGAGKMHDPARHTPHPTPPPTQIRAPPRCGTRNSATLPAS